MGGLTSIIRREFRLAHARRAEWGLPLVFYVIVVTAFALGGEPGTTVLAPFAASIAWVSALLAVIVSQERAFREDFEDGFIEQMALAPDPLAVLIGAKLLAQWILTGLPLAITAPFVASTLGLQGDALPVLGIALLLGTPALILLTGFGAALTVALPRAGLLLPLLVLPLCLPILVFGAGAVRAAQEGLSVAGPLYFVAALTMLCACGVPLACAAALRAQLE
jgi:heme exporter protein B